MMSIKIIDSHIHLDLYSKKEQQHIIDTMQNNHIAGLITVSNHLQSAKANYELSKMHPAIFPAFGFHPEQPLPTDVELEKLIRFTDSHREEIVAIGEVGLPYYLRKEQSDIENEPYIELLEEFIILAKTLEKPIVLHAIYEDAPIVIQLLEKHSVEKAHFHWFKGDGKTLEHIAENGYFISVTPDITYKERTQRIVKNFPLNQMMVETDGPWPFEGPFKGQMTHPKMIHESVKTISTIKNIDSKIVCKQLYENTRAFYAIH